MTGFLQAIIEWDRSSFLAINNGFRSEALDRIVPLATNLGLGWVQACIVLAIAVVLGYRKGEFAGRRIWEAVKYTIYLRRGWVSPLLVSFAFSGIASTIIKNSLERDRPSWYYEKEHQAGRSESIGVSTVPGVYPLRVRGFPSGHTATSVAMATSVTILFASVRRARWRVAAAWIFSIGIAYTRIYLGSHWTLDILGAAAIGVICGWAAVAVCANYARKHEAPKLDAEVNSSRPVEAEGPLR